MKCKIFYSWQSDLPNRDNRSFIEECIKKSIKSINKTIDIGLVVDYDRDTKDETGTPVIIDTIFEKIEKADMFICDVSIIIDSTNKPCVFPKNML